MKSFYVKYKDIIIGISIALILTTGLYFLIKSFSKSNVESPKEIKSEIEVARDSIADLLDRNTELDRKNASNDLEIKVLKYSLEKIAVKETVVKEIHHERIKVIEKYKSNDIVVYFNNNFGPDSISR